MNKIRKIIFWLIKKQDTKKIFINLQFDIDYNCEHKYYPLLVESLLKVF
jgi:hypothetical protein